MKLEEIDYKGRRSVKLTQNGIEAVVTVDVGPRVVFFGFTGGKNHFHEDERQLKEKGNTYTMYGGHRLWHSPEDKERTYEADNGDVAVTREAGGMVSFTSAVDPLTKTQKCMQITMTDTGMKLTHIITNCGPWEIELSAWGLSVMDVNGLCAIPQNRKDTGLLGNRSIGLWPYTRMSDERIYWGDKYITVAGSPKAERPLKIATQNESEFAAYFNHGQLFVKKFEYIEGMPYPDFNDNFAVYSCKDFTEVESLSPLEVIDKGECVVGQEEWFLFDQVKRPAANDEDGIDRILAEHGFTAR